MDYRNVRAGIRMAKLGRFGTGFLAADAFAVGILGGGLLNSWTAGIATFIVAMAGAGGLARPLPPDWITMVTGAMSLIWTATAALVAVRCGSQPAVSAAVALVAGTLAYATHLAGFLALRDIERDES